MPFPDAFSILFHHQYKYKHCQTQDEIFDGAKACVSLSPARSLSAVGAKVIPISVTKVPTTTCGKSFKILSMKKDKRKITATGGNY